jgi:ABC-2 type transport system permease protein
MNILRIAGKELKVFRDIKMLVFMLATPVLLILILGTALSGSFQAAAKIDPIRVLYAYESADAGLMTQWESYRREAEAAAGVTFEEDADRANVNGIREVQLDRYAGYVSIAEGGISYAGNSDRKVENGIVQGLLTAFADRAKLSMAMAGARVPDAYGEHVVTASVEAAKQPGGLDYFAVAVTTMIILYSALTAGQLIENERSRHTDIRLLASPVTKGEIFAGKIVGTLVINAIFVAIIILISKYMYQADWGGHIWLVYIVLLTEVVFALSLGLGVGYCLQGNAAGSVLMIIIQAAAFLGGAYSPVEDMTGMMRTLADYSPLHWSNDAILNIIYADNLQAGLPAMLLNLGCSVLLLALALVLMRRREGL